ncbi:Quinate permease [Cladophialophora carrionii]|uniref:Quinate permease n=1 Tax=Cladophialophora carrionii TaxID=86049 RepID=A0A1C1C6U7_9EURO|nr:Quinate permease [Cladophialophora carrionii]
MARGDAGYRFFKRIVHNDAMAQDPPEIYGWRALFLAMSSGFGAMLFGMDSSIISGVVVLPAFLARFGLDGAGSKAALANLQANIVSTLQAGCFAGAIIAGFMADRIGRRRSLLVAGTVVLVGVLLQFNAWGHLAALYVGRFIAGLGVGVCSVVTPLYTSENVPRAIRGLLTGTYQFFIVLGGMLAYWINYGSSLHLPGDSSWVVPLAVQGLPAVLLLVCMFLCNESPRWLAKQDRWEEAKAILSKVRMLPATHEYVEAEFGEMVTQLENERALMRGAGFKDLMREMWLIPGNRRRAILVVVLMICQQMTGTNAINNYAPLIFQNIGVQGHNTGLFATGIYGIVKCISCAIFLLFLADTLGRRKSLLWTAIGQGCCMLFIGLYIRISPPIKGEPVPAVGYVALVCIFLFAAFFQFGWGPVWYVYARRPHSLLTSHSWIYASEIPTARLRALTVALAAATQWLFNFVVARSVPVMLVTVGYVHICLGRFLADNRSANGYGTYLIFCSFAFTMFVFTWFFIPEVRDIRLPETNPY